MAGMARFRIPSAKEMDQMEDKQPQVMSAFGRSSKSSPIKSDVKKTLPENTTSVVTTSTSQRPQNPRSSTAITNNSNHSFKPKEIIDKPSDPVSSVDNKAATEGGSGSLLTTPTSTSDQGAPLVNKPSKTNSLIVSTRQKGNPILKHVRNVPWELGDIIPDYVMGQTTCGLFLSLRYHALNPNYIHERFKQLGHSFDLRVLLVQVDTKDPQFALSQLAKVCILTDCTLLLAWTPEEAGRYLETYKSFEVKPPDLIMEKTESNYMAQLTDTLTTVKKVNKTDAMTLLTAFGSMEKIVEASEEDMSLCPGFGPQKAKRLHSVFHEPFIKTKKAKPEIPESPKKVAASPRKKKVDLS